MSRETPHPGTLASPTYGGDCPMCGGQYESTLPYHLRYACPEVPR